MVGVVGAGVAVGATVSVGRVGPVTVGVVAVGATVDSVIK